MTYNEQTARVRDCETNFRNQIYRDFQDKKQLRWESVIYRRILESRLKKANVRAY